MREQGISFTTTGAIAALALAAAACGGSESAEPSETAEADPEVLPTDDGATDGSSTVDTATAPATGVASTEPTDSRDCSEPEPTGPALDIGVVAQFDNEAARTQRGSAPVSRSASASPATSSSREASIVRAMIADPEFVKKARDGRESEIRAFIGTSMGCVAQLMTTRKI